jgi:DNA-binding transcriptional MerR regulator/methylmalonyl-CoA mutase cobalamin-binding subunit
VGVYKIKDVEILVGIKAHTLRIWEQRYGMLVPERTETKIRMYTDEELVYLLNVRILLDHGLKISKISALSATEIREKVAEIKLGTPAGASQEKLILALVEMDESLFNKTLDDIIVNSSLERAFKDCLIPFFDRIGVMWLTNSINPAQEHFISNLIRQKIVAEINQLPVPDRNSPVVMLYLPEHEWHEIGILFYQYLLRVKGVFTIYLGQSLPYDSLLIAIEKVRPDVLLTSWLTSVEEHYVKNYFKQLRAAQPELTILAGGAQIGIHKDVVSPYAITVQSSEVLMELITAPHLQFSQEQQ